MNAVVVIALVCAARAKVIKESLELDRARFEKLNGLMSEARALTPGDKFDIRVEFAAGVVYVVKLFCRMF